MNIHLDVFGALMLNRVAKKVNHTHIITIDQSSVVIGQCSSNNKFLIQQGSDTTFATPRYSALALDRESVGWRLADQEIRLSPSSTQ